MLYRRSKPLIALVGKSGVGKTTLGNSLAEFHGLSPVVSYTSRPPREGEVDGVDYHFRSKEWFEDNRGLFAVDLTFFDGSYYAAADADLGSKDFIVIKQDDALALRSLGVSVFIVLIEGPCRSSRGRKDDVWTSRRDADLILSNDGPSTVSQLAARLAFSWSVAADRDDDAY